MDLTLGGLSLALSVTPSLRPYRQLVGDRSYDEITRNRNAETLTFVDDIVRIHTRFLILRERERAYRVLAIPTHIEDLLQDQIAVIQTKRWPPERKARVIEHTERLASDLERKYGVAL